MLIFSDRLYMLYAGHLFQLHCVNQLFKAHCPVLVFIKKEEEEEEEAVFPFK